MVHADESCLGNGREGSNPGGAGGLVEIAKPEGVARRDYFLSEPATTNNRMAIRSAIEALRLMNDSGRRRLKVDFVTDSEYLKKGHAKNEYADHRATKAARELGSSGGLVESGFAEWLEKQRAKGKYADYDPDDLNAG